MRIQTIAILLLLLACTFFTMCTSVYYPPQYAEGVHPPKHTDSIVYHSFDSLEEYLQKQDQSNSIIGIALDAKCLYCPSLSKFSFYQWHTFQLQPVHQLCTAYNAELAKTNRYFKVKDKFYPLVVLGLDGMLSGTSSNFDYDTSAIPCFNIKNSIIIDLYERKYYTYPFPPPVR